MASALPHLNGYPARVIVPGWTATYWMKRRSPAFQLQQQAARQFLDSERLSRPGWDVRGGSSVSSQDNPKTWPITEIVVNSVVARIRSKRSASSRQRLHDRRCGMGSRAWHQAGGGIAGRWQELEAGDILARITGALRVSGIQLQHRQISGRQLCGVIACQRNSNAGETQVDKLKFNPAGYQPTMCRSRDFQSPVA